MIDYRLLGPLEVAVNGHAVDVGGLKQRALLAILLLHANQPVHRDVLIDQLWAEHPPAGAEHAVEVYIWRLRKALEPAAGSQGVLTRPGAYLLRAAEEQVDVARFERLAEAGRRALAAEDPGRAAADLGEALALWRGPLLADFRSEPFAQAEIARLEELRAGVVEDRIEADLALGRHAAVVSELEALVAVQTLRERLHQQLMIALYRCGRQADALAVYQKARRMLVADLGIEPGEPLRRLERAILEQDPSLEPPPSPRPSQASGLADGTRLRHPAGAAGQAVDPAAERGSPRRSAWIGGKRLLAVALALAVAIALLVVLAGRGQVHLAAGPNTVGVIDGGQAGLSAVVTRVGRPNGIVAGAGAVWITDSADDLLLRVDSARQVIDRIPVGRGPAGVTVADGEVWVANQLDGTLSEVNPGAGTQVAVITVGIGPSAIASGYGSVWVANVTSDTLSRVDAATGAVVSTIHLDSAPTGIAVGAGAVWVTSQETGELLRVDPGDDRPSQAIAIGHGPDGLAVGAGSIWAADAGGAVTRFDPRTGKVQTIRVGGAPAGVAYANGAVWVANSPAGPCPGSIQRLARRSSSISATSRRISPPPASKYGQRCFRRSRATAAARSPSSPSSHRIIALLPTDPAVAYYTQTWQMLSMTNDGLVGYRRVGGLAGDQLVPDLATALPPPTDGGRTYTFHLRAGIRYSTGALVRPEDFRRAIERVFMIDKQANSPFRPSTPGSSARPGANDGPARATSPAGSSPTKPPIRSPSTSPRPTPSSSTSWRSHGPTLSLAARPTTRSAPRSCPPPVPYMTRSLVPGHTWILVRNPRFRAVVTAGAARRLPGPDRPPARRRARPGGRRRRARQGRRPAVPAAG